MSVRACIPAVVAVLGALLVITSTASASAAPIIPPGLNLGSSGGSAPSAPTPGGYGVYTSVEPDLSALEVGTTWSATYVRGDCVTDPNSRGFFWDSGNGNPFRSCFYDPSTALYEYRLDTPTGQQARVLVEFNSGANIPGLARITTECAGGGNVGCERAADTAQRITGAVLTPRPKLGPLPTPPATSYRFCASESLVCRAPAGSTIAFGTGTDFVQKVISDRSIRCTTAQFGGTDPAPGKFKDCFTVG